LRLLDIKNLQVAYGNIKALHGIDFHIDEGEIVTIIGANGAGKSSTLRAISRMVPAGPDTQMTFAEENLLKYPPEKVVSQLGISHVPEGRRLFGNLTVLENLQLATFSRKDKGGIQRDIERVFTIFSRLEERKTQKAITMSGGEQQMLAVGRAFMSGRRMMLLDEPSMGLSPLLMKRVFQSLKQINETEGTAILLVEQNARLALKFAQRGYVLENGHMVLHGSSEELLDNEDVKKAYLGG
jgi:branched-chain amino acid transport system ATP-binding protein